MKNNSNNFNKILKEETNRIKELLVEQGSSDWNCENQAGGGCNCVANLVGCGQYPSQLDCQANTNPNTGPGCPAPNPCCGTVAGCEGNPTLNCWFCLHYPGGQCITFQDYYTYGSGAPGMTPTQVFMDTQVVPDTSNPGVFLSHQGGAIYDNEADCVASGCEPFTATPVVGNDGDKPTSATKPNIKDDKFKGDEFDDSKENIREENLTMDEKFNSLLVEQGGGGFNCEINSSTGVCGCTPNLIGCGMYPTLPDCQSNTNPNTGTGCPAPEPCCSQACPSFHAFHSWPSGYPTNADFTWTGPNINMTFGGVLFNYSTGSIMSGSLANWFNAGQSSYCEWCADYLSGTVSQPNSQGFDKRTNYWAGGGYGPEACDCCPGTNPIGPPLPKMANTSVYPCINNCQASDPDVYRVDGITTFSKERECKDMCTDKGNSQCCIWCMNSGGVGRPPHGCKDFMCDQCSDMYSDMSSDFEITEEVNRIKELLVEQGSGDYNCEIDASTGNCNCVANLVGCGQYPSQLDCQNNTNPNMGPGCPTAEPCCATVTAAPECASVGNGYECYYCPGPAELYQHLSDIRLNEKYQPTTSPVGCKMIGNNTSLLTDGTNLYNTILECETAEEECAAQSTDMEECHCCTTGGASAAYTQNMGFFAVGHCGYCNTSGCNPWNPGSGTLYSNFWNCAPISQGPLDCSIVNPPWTPKLKPTDDENVSRGR